MNRKLKDPISKLGGMTSGFSISSGMPTIATKNYIRSWKEFRDHLTSHLILPVRSVKSREYICDLSNIICIQYLEGFKTELVISISVLVLLQPPTNAFKSRNRVQGWSQIKCTLMLTWYILSFMLHIKCCHIYYCTWQSHLPCKVTWAILASFY